MPKLGHFLVGSLSLLIKLYADQYRQEDLYKTLDELAPDLALPKIETYDFIVVGGGTAGCLVAGRLSNFFSVLLLETGGNPPPIVGNQFFANKISTSTDINYIFPLVQHPKFSGSMGGQRNTSLGKMMGGSGSHNSNIYNRGSPHDYDYFARLVEDDSWCYSKLVEQFKKFENFVGWLVDEGQRNEYYATGGPLNVITALPPFLGAWLQAGKELGFAVGDPNGYQTESFTPMAVSVRDNVRDSTYTSFIEGVEAKPNTKLKVLRYSQVQQILINERKEAYGVTYLRHGIPQIAHASKEVIVSAGAILSPLLLIKSGVGPEEMLKEAGIPVIMNLPGVGNALMDHPVIPMKFISADSNASRDLFPLATESQIQPELVKFQSRPRSGIFTQMIGPQAFIVSSRAKSEGQGNWPDIQLLFVNDFSIDENSTKIAIVTSLTRPKSRGWVRLNTTAYKDGVTDDVKLAIVNSGFLTVPSDVDVIVEGMKLGFKVVETTPYHNLQLKYVRAELPVCDKFLFRSDDYLKCLVIQNTVLYYHYTGTCIMGRSEDPMAVVDSKLKVRGIQNLRVVDASILPTSTDSNTNAPTMVVAQKGSCEILFDHMYPKINALNYFCPLPE